MILEPCMCPWDIPGVDALPAHNHCDRYVGEPGKGHLVPDIYIWVPWKQVTRELAPQVASQHACERGSIRYADHDRNVQEVSFDAPELVHVETGRVAETKRTGGPERASGARVVSAR